MTIPYDYIKHAKRIEDSLKLIGFEAMASRFEDTRLAGATSGEILMGLRHECLLAQSDSALLPEIKADILALVQAVNAAGI